MFKKIVKKMIRKPDEYPKKVTMRDFPKVIPTSRALQLVKLKNEKMKLEKR